MKLLSTAAVLLLVALGALSCVGQQPYPKPQIASAAGKLAPDFTLEDSQGKPFTLSQQRGHDVVLYFYRGYW